ncbi:MAG: ATP-binding protein [Candidatus Omnitrophica bacterium]|nr:ATP-binding protein [Candidatus Omnitrophota bacterium]
MIFKSIKERIFFLNFILLIGVILFLGVSSYWLLREYLFRTEKDRLHHISDIINESIQYYLLERAKAMGLIINNIAIDEYFLMRNKDILYDYFNRLKHGFPVIGIFNMRGKQEVKLIEGRLSEEEEDLSNNPYFKQALEKVNQIVIAPQVELSLSLKGIPTIKLMITRTSYFRDNPLVVLVAEVLLSDIHQLIYEHIKDKSYFIIIIDKEGNLLACPEKDRLLIKLNGEGKNFEELLFNATSLKSGFTRASIMGIDALVSYVPLKNLSWSVLAGLSYADFMKAPNTLKKIVGIIFLCVFIIAAFVLTKLAEYISFPLKRITALTSEIAKGDFSKQIDFKSQDEIGRLSDSFNLMIQNLQKTLVSRDELSKEIEERKAIEEELLNSLEQLQQTQEELIQTAKMASLGQLAAGLAHEINNPLTGVLNNVQLLKMEMEAKPEGISSSELKEILDIIEEAAMRCKKITQSLLDFSRASRQDQQRVSMNEVVERVVDLVSHELRLQNILIQTNLDPQLPLLQGNPQLLQQVVMNIITNAQWAIKKKSGPQGGTISIRTEQDLKNQRVNVFISDTGIGISDETRQRIFEPFFTTKEVGEGTGLGLAVVYRIIQDHKGSIEVESKLGEGTTFKLSLPIFEEKKEI